MEINLAKCTQGCILHLNNTKKYEVESIEKINGEYYQITTTDNISLTYNMWGVNILDSKLNVEAIEISNIQKKGRIEGQIIGMVNSIPYVTDKFQLEYLNKRIEKLKKQLENF